MPLSFGGFGVMLKASLHEDTCVVFPWPNLICLCYVLAGDNMRQRQMGRGSVDRDFLEHSYISVDVNRAVLALAILC